MPRYSRAGLHTLRGAFICANVPRTYDHICAAIYRRRRCGATLPCRVDVFLCLTVYECVCAFTQKRLIGVRHTLAHMFARHDDAIMNATDLDGLLAGWQRSGKGLAVFYDVRLCMCLCAIHTRRVVSEGAKHSEGLVEE